MLRRGAVMEALKPPIHCEHLNGDLLFVTHQLSVQEYLVNNEQGSWRVVLRDDLKNFKLFDVDGAEAEDE
jgi:hypothetical protein